MIPNRRAVCSMIVFGGGYAAPNFFSVVLGSFLRKERKGGLIQ